MDCAHSYILFGLVVASHACSSGEPFESSRTSEPRPLTEDGSRTRSAPGIFCKLCSTAWHRAPANMKVSSAPESFVGYCAEKICRPGDWRLLYQSKGRWVPRSPWPIGLEAKSFINLFSTSIFAMRHFRRSRPSADTPPLTPESPAELARMLTAQRDSRALAAASSVIALSITSAFDGTHDVPSDGAADRGIDTGWRTAYAAARMAIEVAKESSDMFLPLKAVVGAMSVLMKNCDVSAPYLRTERVFIHSLHLALANGR